MKLSRKATTYMAIEFILFEFVIALIVALGMKINEKALSEFDRKDQWFFLILIAIIIICVIFALFVAYKLKKEFKPMNPNKGYSVTDNKEPLINKRGLIIFACALILLPP